MYFWKCFPLLDTLSKSVCHFHQSSWQVHYFSRYVPKEISPNIIVQERSTILQTTLVFCLYSWCPSQSLGYYCQICKCNCWCKLVSCWHSTFTTLEQSSWKTARNGWKPQIKDNALVTSLAMIISTDPCRAAILGRIWGFALNGMI